MHKLVCFLAVLLAPVSLHAEDYNPAAPSKGSKIIENMAKESPFPAPEPKLPNNTPKPLKPPKFDKDKFDKYDTDKSGKLSYKEYVRYIGRNKPQDVGLQKKFLRLDKNGDYKLSVDELKNP